MAHVELLRHPYLFAAPSYFIHLYDSHLEYLGPVRSLSFYFHVSHQLDKLSEKTRAKEKEQGEDPAKKKAQLYDPKDVQTWTSAHVKRIVQKLKDEKREEERRKLSQSILKMDKEEAVLLKDMLNNALFIIPMIFGVATSLITTRLLKANFGQ
uniref:Uncharacterized protein n=1 Tax=Strombidium rassoulzadegani TaxID=1082188 RepID=A0A7S3CIV8_9SPIT|mmetsp:Transcript_12403/g.20842  ORF Transcript_12403/g.20842 Transcript_12403/m.20842 type:complete len:153 (+) Transcript_12403:28-486(+)